MNDRQLHSMPTARRHGHASITASVAYDVMNIARRNIPRAIPLCDALQWLPVDRYVKLLLKAKHQIEHIDTHAKTISDTTMGSHLQAVGILARLDGPRKP